MLKWLPMCILLFSLIAATGCRSPSLPKDTQDSGNHTGQDTQTDTDTDTGTPPDGPELWAMISANLQSEESCAEAMALMDRAAAAGFTGIFFSSFFDALIRTDELHDWGYDNLAEVLAHAADLGLPIMKSFGVSGYGGARLRSDHNHAEGLPVRGTPYKDSQEGT